MTPVKVWPTKANALILKHPNGPKMTPAGVLWPKDSFTARRLREGSVTQDQTKAYVAPKPAGPAAPAEPAKG